MDFTTQLILLLSEPPGSFLYHLLTLFALQIVFAISFARYRRDPQDGLARHMSVASGAIFVGQLLLLLSGFILRDRLATAAVVLPPLERALGTASLALLVWSFLARPARSQRAADIALIVTLILCGVFFLFSAQTWQTTVTDGATGYNGSTQATIWSMLQIAILTAGLVFVLLRERQLGPYPPAILAILLAAHIVTLWNYPGLVATGSNVAYWTRLGNLIALPLWAVFAYQHATAPAFGAKPALVSGSTSAGKRYQEAAQLIATKQTTRRLALGLALAQEALDSQFTAVALSDPGNPDNLLFRSSIPAPEDGRFLQWQMNLDSNQTLRTAIGQDRPVELQEQGIGARQLHAIYQAAGLSPQGPILIQPLVAPGQRLGLLLAAGQPDRVGWTEEELQAFTGLAAFLAQAVLNSQTAAVLPPSEPSPESPSPTTAVPAAIIMDRQRLQDLQRELVDVRAQLAQAIEARKVAETSALAAQKQARYLAAALRVAQTPRANPDPDVFPPFNHVIEEQADE